MNALLSSAGVLLLAYLVGSVAFAVLVSRIMRLQDPRSFGSKNPGATNVLRTGNKTAAVLTLAGDAFKGTLVVYLAQWLADARLVPAAVVAASAVAVFLGHLFPVFLRFRGGKGVATALGVLLAISPWLALLAALTWLLVAYVSRYSSLAAIISAVCAPVYYLLGHGVAWKSSGAMTFALTVVAALLIARHAQNVQRLLQGTESRLGAKHTQKGRGGKKRRSGRR